MKLDRSARCLAAASAIAILLVAAQPAGASNADPLPQGSRYVALGSSFASGPGLNLIDPMCSRSSNNYPSLVATSLDLTLTDVSCGGATVGNVLDVPQFGRPPQIQSVTADTKLVTVTVGGNDAQYLSQLIRTACQANPAPVDAALVGLPPFLVDLVRPALCAPMTDADRSASQIALDLIAGRLVDLIEQIRVRAPDARIVLVDYVTIVPQSGRTCDGLPLSQSEAKYFLDVARQLQLATKHAAQQSGAELVEASKASRGHDACSNDPWVFGFEFGNILAGGAKAFHPNAAGMTAVADLVAQTITQPQGV
jgi:lysophospholipase L1-like esterase